MRSELCLDADKFGDVADMGRDVTDTSSGMADIASEVSDTTSLMADKICDVADTPRGQAVACPFSARRSGVWDLASSRARCDLNSKRATASTSQSLELCMDADKFGDMADTGRDVADKTCDMADYSGDVSDTGRDVSDTPLRQALACPFSARRGGVWDLVSRRVQCDPYSKRAAASTNQSLELCLDADKFGDMADKACDVADTA